MAGRGRPIVEDKRDNQYRVLMNDEEDSMLAYCSRMTGMPKSQIFRKGIEVLYQQIQLNEADAEYNDHISMKRVIKCPHCGYGNTINLGDYSTGEHSYERQMGQEIEYSFQCEDYKCGQCGKSFTVSGSIHEYPIGAYDSEHIEVKP